MSDEREVQLLTQLDRIAEKLHRLREADRAFSVFGSYAHGYLLGPRLPERDLLAIEQRLGIHLPTEYRLFLAHLGEGGAGPYYGLFRLDGDDSDDITNPECICKPFRWSEAFNPYDWEDPCGQEDVWCDHEQVSGNPQIILSVPGALYICNFGCAIRFFVVVNGPCVGEVWRDSQTDEAGIIPERGEDGRHLGFLNWYENWLNQAIDSRHRST
jgi:hypothetical protein